MGLSSKIILNLGILVFCVVSAVCYLLLTRLGVGVHITENEVFNSLKPLLKSSHLEVVAELPYPPGNVAVSAEGRVFFSFHPEYDPPVKVAELTPSGRSIAREFRPFPSPGTGVAVTSVLSLRIDNTNNRLYLLDFGLHGFKSVPALVGYQLASPGSGRVRDELFQHHVFPASVAGRGSMLNDLQISPDGTIIIIVDTSIVGLTPAVIVYCVDSRVSYRVLSEAKQLFGQSARLTIPTVFSAPLETDEGSQTCKAEGDASCATVRSLDFPNLGPAGIRIHVDSVALSRDGKTLFFGALTGDILFGLPMESLLRETIHAAGPTPAAGAGVIVSAKANKNLTQSMSAVKLSVGVSTHHTTSKSKFRRKPITDGMTSDLHGNLFFTACEHSAIGVLKVDYAKNDLEGGSSKKRYNYRMLNLVQSPELLRWPDGFSFGGAAGDNGLYITNSALHLKVQHHGHSNLVEAMRAYAPFHILKVPQKLLDKHLYDQPSEYSVVSGLSGQ
jgi:hypothetical protein